LFFGKFFFRKFNNLFSVRTSNFFLYWFFLWLHWIRLQWARTYRGIFL
jgi:hypothetical protein